MRPRLYFTQIAPLKPEHLARLKAFGWTCIHYPMRAVHYLPVDLPDDIGVYDALLVTSGHAAHWLAERFADDPPPVAVVGDSTASILRRAGLASLFEGAAAVNADALVEKLAAHFEKRSRFLFLRGASARDTLPQVLGEAGHQVDCLTVYQTVLRAFEGGMPEGMVYFQAPSCVTDFAARFGRAPRWTAAIGPSTAAAMADQGWRVDFMPARPETHVFIEELARWAQDQHWGDET